MTTGVAGVRRYDDIPVGVERGGESVLEAGLRFDQARTPSGRAAPWRATSRSHVLVRAVGHPPSS